MAQFTVRDLEEDVKLQLKQRAAQHGVSMEEEVRCILRNAVRPAGLPKLGLGTRISARFARTGLTQDLPELRGQGVRAADLA